jgi:hypothetical protein
MVMEINNSQKNESKFTAIVKTGIRSIAASFPVAASLANAWSEWDANKKWEYVLEFFKEAERKFSEFEERINVQEQFLKTEEAPHLLTLTLEKVMREHREEKRKRFVEFFLNSLAIANTIEFDEKRYFLEVLDELDEYDIQILSLIKESGKIKIDKIKDLGLDKIIVSISKLQSRAIISETSRGKPVDTMGWTGNIDSWENRWRKKWFELLPIGKRFIEFLTLNKE